MFIHHCRDLRWLGSAMSELAVDSLAESDAAGAFDTRVHMWKLWQSLEKRRKYAALWK